MTNTTPRKVGPHSVLREMKVLSLGLPRTGSYSICVALTELGYKDVYHGLHAIDNVEDFAVFGRAADALFPSLPTFNGKGMTSKDWDEVFGPSEAVTDLAGPFAESLIGSYPDAKVIIVIRDYEKWRKSFEDILSGIFGRVTMFIRKYIEPLTGDYTATNVQKMLRGWTGAEDFDGIMSRSRETYDSQNEGLPKLIPEGQLLLYRLGDGWGPLCEFLGKDIPDAPFPHGNEAAALRRTIFFKQLRTFREAGMKLGPYVLGAATIAGAAWLAWS